MLDVSPIRFRMKDGEPEIILLQTEIEAIARKFFTISDNTFNIGVFTSKEKRKGLDQGETYLITIKDRATAARLQNSVMAEDAVKRSCCQRSYFRGAFLAGGTISDPNRYYNLEVVCSEEQAADTLRAVLQEMGLPAKTIRRKNQSVVYIQEADCIAEALRLMGANLALMEFENIRIMREMRGSINRQVNCETANLKKTINAAHRQIEDIQFLQENGGFDHLSPVLVRAAEIRLAYPDASLTELGSFLNPPVGKSGMNHRLRKLQEAADILRAGGEL